MVKLLRSNLYRLSKSVVFWIEIALLFLITIIFMLNGCRESINMQNLGYAGYESIDKYYFNLAPYIGMFSCVIISLMIGTEYSDGALRNKIITGCTRTNIYLANLLTNIFISTCFVIIWLLSGLVGLFKLSPLQMPASQIFSNILVIILFSACISSIFTVIGMLVHSKTSSAIISILIFNALLIIALMINSALNEPELTNGIIISQNGIELCEPIPNPRYIGGNLRKVLEIFIQIIPTGQSILIWSSAITNPAIPILSSVLLIGVFSYIGLTIFRKQDLK